MTRPDLHFLHNLIETVPLVIGFVYQLAWLRHDIARGFEASVATEDERDDAPVAEPAF